MFNKNILVNLLSEMTPTVFVSRLFWIHSVTMCHCVLFRSMCDKIITIAAAADLLLETPEHIPDDYFRQKKACQRGVGRQKRTFPTVGGVDNVTNIIDLL